MDREQHAERLRRAMRQAGFSNADLATAVGVSTRTITSWISRSEPRMPRETEQETLRALLPGYSDGGDGVEASIARSGLAPYRQAEVLAVYLRHMEEQQNQQRREDSAGA